MACNLTNQSNKNTDRFSLWSVVGLSPGGWEFWDPQNMKGSVFLETKPRIESQTTGPQINPWLRSSQTKPTSSNPMMLRYDI